MPQILVEDLRKSFRIAERDPGMLGALRGVLRRRYRTIDALDGVSFAIEPGELVGYIGPNGAGKSTTVKVISGILVPDSGRVEILGRTPWDDRTEHVRRIGVVFGQRTHLWWDLPVVESFELLRDIYRVPQSDYANARDEMIALLDLESLLDVPVRQLSLGQRMRCDLASALLHRPELLFLDEPTIGLDAVSKLAVRDFIKRLNRDRNTTVILTTHDMDDIEALCSRVMVIGKGRILSDGTLADLRATVTRERRLIVDLDERDVEIADPDARVTTRDGHRVTLSFDPERVTVSDLIARITSTYRVRDLFVENPPIEEIIATMYRGERVVRAYLAVVGARFRTLLQYRAAAAAGLGTQPFWGLIRVMIFEAFYRASSEPQPIDVEDVVGYVWLGQAFLMLQPWGIDRDIRDQIRTGSVAYELLRPLDLYGFWYCRAIALKTAPTLLRSVPLLLIAGLFFGLPLPDSLPALAAFAVSVAAAVFLGAAITMLLNISLLWTISGDGITSILPAVVFIFSGMIVPLPLFPEWSRPLLEALPFRYIADVPFRLYLGHIPAADLPWLMVQCLGWTVALVAAGRVVLAVARRRLVVQGG